jgi:hypothetical protein
VWLIFGVTDNVIRLNPFELRERNDEVRSRRRRLRRVGRPPDDFQHDLAAGVRFPKEWPSPLPDITVRYRVDRWMDLDGHGTVHFRQLTAWLLHRRRRVGAFRFSQYVFDHSPNDSVFWAMDGQSTESARLGDVLTMCWSDLTMDVGDYGSVVEFEKVWLVPGVLPPWAWLPIAEGMIDWFWKERAALLIAHLFPLEYEHVVGEFTPSRMGFERRLRAMRRAAQRKLGLQGFPGKLGDFGWTWRIRPGLEAEILAPEILSEPQTTLLF